MSPISLDELSALAVSVEEPAHSSPYTPRLGGVDPLGLRQINFDLMDQVIPGLNNVARHIRPFTVVCWAWRRAAECARSTGHSHVALSDLRDFVNRVEVLFGWSQFLANPAADLPGRDVLAPLLTSPSYRFGGEEWQKKKDVREYSTALSAPVNYGPALKNLGWLQPDAERTGAMIPSTRVRDAVDSLNRRMLPYLDHPAFASLGEVTVDAADVLRWSQHWALDDPSAEERRAMADTFFDDLSALRVGADLVRSAVKFVDSSHDVVAIRKAMCGPPSAFPIQTGLADVSNMWRDVQARQLFRFALEATFHWSIQQLDAGSKTTDSLVRLFLQQAGTEKDTATWIESVRDPSIGLVDGIESLSDSLFGNEAGQQIPRTIRTCIATALSEDIHDRIPQRHDRLPNSRAARELMGFANASPEEFLGHLFESWIFGQHVYWAVGRGLATLVRETR